MKFGDTKMYKKAQKLIELYNAKGWHQTAREVRQFTKSVENLNKVVGQIESGESTIRLLCGVCGGKPCDNINVLYINEYGVCKDCFDIDSNYCACGGSTLDESDFCGDCV